LARRRIMAWQTHAAQQTIIANLTAAICARCNG
jgi:hypothetical protein